MGGDDNGKAVFFCDEVEGGEEVIEVFVVVDVFFAMGRDDEIFFFFQAKATKYIGSKDPGHIVMKYLIHGAAGFDDAVGRKTLAQQVFAGYAAVCEVDIGDMVHNLAVGFFRNALVEATVAGFHMEDRNMTFFGRDGAKAGIGVAKYKEGIGFYLFKHRFDIDKDLADSGGGSGTGGVEEVVGFAYAEVVVEDLVKLVVVVLAGVDGDVLDGFGGVEGGHDAG